jgi:predicted DNA-binding protein YlxM (UPF0122 family)
MFDNKAILNVTEYIQEHQASFQTVKDQLHNKILDAFKRVEDYFDVILQFNFNDNKNVVFNFFEIEFTKYESSSFCGFVATSVHDTISCDVGYFPFSITPTNTAFSLKFNSDFELSSVIISSRNFSMLKPTSSANRLDLVFDDNFKLKEISRTFQNEVILKKTESNLSSYEEELKLFQISESNINNFIDYLPEFYIPAAYDFNSIDFKDRMSVYDMSCL